MMANDGVMPFERFYRMKPDVGHIHTFRCIMHVTLPKEMLGKLEDHRAMGYLMGYKYDSGYRVWIPHIGVREVRDVTFYKGTVPVLPNHGSTAEVQCAKVQVVPPLETTPGPTSPTPMPTSHNTEDANKDNNKGNGAPAAASLAQEKLTIHMPSCYHPHAPKPATASADNPTDHIPSNLAGDTDDDMLQYVS